MSKSENSFAQLQENTFEEICQKWKDKPTHLVQAEQPWSRLHDTATVASSLRSTRPAEQQVSNDSLDFQLTSVYDHHKDFFWHKNQILYQRETVSENHRKQEKLPDREKQGDIRVWVDPQRRSIHSIK